MDNLQMNIPIGVAGRILNPESGEDKWPYILVYDYGEKSGGYHIFSCSAPTFDVAPVYDDWTLKEELEAYFAAMEWEIEWSEDRPIPHHGLF